MRKSENHKLSFLAGFALHVLPAFWVIGILICSNPPFPATAWAQTSHPVVSVPVSELSLEDSDLTADAHVTYKILPNGFRYVMMQNREPRDRVSMHLVVQAGSYQETEDQRGVAHFLEHMMFNGSEHFPPGELVKYFQMIGMQFGPDANAHTGFVETVYDVLLPEGNLKGIEGGLLVLKDYARGALLLEEEIDRERNVILAEKRSRDSADYRTLVASLQFEFPDARFSHRLAIGEESVIRSADRELMKRFYDTWYRPEKMVLVMVGEFDPAMAGALVEKAFGDMIARVSEVPDPDFGELSHTGVKTFYHHEPEVGTTSVAVEVVRKVEKRSDLKQYRREEIVLEMAERMVQNRLDERLSLANVPFTSATINMGRFMQQVEYAEISADCRPENWEDTLSQIEQTLRQALVYGFTDSELARVKKDFLSSLDHAVAQASTRESGNLANEIIWHVNNRRVFLSPEQEEALLGPVVSEATKENVHEALQKAWAQDHRLIFVTGNASLEESGETPEKRILPVYERSTRQAMHALEDGEKVTFPYLSKPASEGKISRREEIKDLGIVQVDFANGVRLNIKKTDFEAGKVRVAIAFGKGKFSEPPGKAGLSMLSEEVINESGLGRLDKNQLASALAGTQVNAGFEISEDRFLLRGACASREIELLLQVLYAHFVDPGFRQDAFHLSMERFEQLYQTFSRDIDGGMNLQGRTFLAGGDLRFGMPPLEMMRARTLTDVRTWILSALNSSVLEVNVVGDVDTATVIDSVADWFGALPGRRAPAKRDPGAPISFPVGKVLDIKVDTQIPKGLVVLAYPTDDYWDISRTRRLSVLADIFSEKLREKIREQLGASYSPFAYNQPSRAFPGYGMLQAYVYVAPEEAEVVIGAVKDLARGLVQNSVSAEDLDRSLKPILTSIKDYRRTNTYWLDRVLTGSLNYPQQLEWSRTFEADYASITIEDVRRFAETYLVDANASCITVLPEQGD